MKLRLNKNDLKPFLTDLMVRYDLFAPVRLAEEVSVCRKIDRPEEADLTQPNPQKPAKDVFFPQSEVMFRYEQVGRESRIMSMEEVKRERILLGARPCDIAAISLIEKVFAGSDSKDVYFLEKRRKTMIIGLGCNDPRSTCFCSSAGGHPFSRIGSDLFLVDLGETYLVEVLTERGRNLQNSPYLKDANSEDLLLAKELEEKASEKLGPQVPIDGIERRLDLMAESPFWDRVHEGCVGCRICTYLCPTCHCFDITDEGDSKKGQRVRHWDSCLSPLYSLETSGHNPRPTTRERTRQRLMHKFNYFPKNFGQVACVGCGRCIVYCPIHFDIRKAILWTSRYRQEDI